MHYEATVKFLSPEEGGGRINPPQSGYRPHLKLGDVCTSCMILLPEDNDAIMNFGQEYHVHLKLMIPIPEYQDRITPNMDLEFYEGSRLVGIGKLSG